MRGRAHRERVEEKPELRALLLRGQRQQVEDLRLQIGLVDPERAATQLVAVDDDVVGVRDSGTGLVGEAVVAIRPSDG